MESVTQLYSTHTDLDRRRPFKLHVSAEAGLVPVSAAPHSCFLFLPIYLQGSS